MSFREEAESDRFNGARAQKELYARSDRYLNQSHLHVRRSSEVVVLNLNREARYPVVKLPPAFPEVSDLILAVSQRFGIGDRIGPYRSPCLYDRPCPSPVISPDVFRQIIEVKGQYDHGVMPRSLEFRLM